MQNVYWYGFQFHSATIKKLQYVELCCSSTEKFPLSEKSIKILFSFQLNTCVRSDFICVFQKKILKQIEGRNTHKMSATTD